LQTAGLRMAQLLKGYEVFPDLARSMLRGTVSVNESSTVAT